MLRKKLLPALCALVLAFTPVLAGAQDLGDDAISLNFGVSNLPVDLFEYDETFALIGKEFVPEGVTVSFDFVLEYSPVPGGLSRMTLEATVPNLLQFSSKFDFIITEDLTAFLELDSYQQLEKLLISSFEMQYEDHGFIAMLGALTQCQEQRSLTQLQEDLFDFLNTQDASFHPLWDDALHMLHDQLEKPGQIALSYKPVEPGSAPVHLFELLFVRHPENYSLSWQQGQTPLLEQIPPSLRWNEESNTGPCLTTAPPESVEQPAVDNQPAIAQPQQLAPEDSGGSSRKQTRNGY